MPGRLGVDVSNYRDIGWWSNSPYNLQQRQLQAEQEAAAAAAEAERKRVAEQQAAVQREVAAIEFRRIEAQKQASGFYAKPVYRYAGQVVPASTATGTGSAGTTGSTTSGVELATPVGTSYRQPSPTATSIPGQTAASLLAIRRAAMGKGVYGRKMQTDYANLNIPSG